MAINLIIESNSTIEGRSLICNQEKFRKIINLSKINNNFWGFLENCRATNGPCWKATRLEQTFSTISPSSNKANERISEIENLRIVNYFNWLCKVVDKLSLRTAWKYTLFTLSIIC